jgi:hypothetical protein
MNTLSMIPCVFLLTLPVLSYSEVDAHPITINFDVETANRSLVSGEPMTANEEVGLSQPLTNHVYYSLSTTLPKHQSYSSELDLGLQTKIKRIMPFAELEMVDKSTEGHHQVMMDYDVGAAYALTDRLTPVIVLDGLGVNGENAVIYGLSIQLTKKIAVTCEGLKVLNTTGSAAKFSFLYTL